MESVKRVMITPEYAAKLLEKNTANFRRRDIGREAMIAKDINAGNWKFNGATIIIREDETIADGQTRLWACVKSGKPIESLVIYGGVEDERTIDEIRPRGAAQHMANTGVPSANLAASIVRSYLQYFPATGKAQQACKVSTSQIVEFYELNPTLVQTVRECSRAKMLPGLSASILGAVHFAGCKICIDTSARWIDGIRSGENLSADDPEFMFRKKFYAMNAMRAPGRYEQAELMVKAWNMRYFNVKGRQLIFRIAGDEPEDFPILGQARKS